MSYMPDKQMKHVPAIITIVSAFAYIFAFLFPKLSVVFMPLSLILLAYSAGTESLRFSYGMLWGMLVYACLTYPLLILSYTIRSGSISGRIAAWFLLVCYTAFYAGLWFWLMQRFNSLYAYFVNHPSPTFYSVRYFVWVVTSLLYFSLIDRAFLWPFNYIEGYTCVYPVVPLVASLPDALFVLNKELLLLVLLVFSAVTTHILVTSYIRFQLRGTSFVLLLSFLFITAAYTKKWQPGAREFPDWIGRVGYISPPWSFESRASAWDCGHTIFKLLELAYAQNPDLVLVLLPESACAYPLNKYPEIIIYWFSVFPPEKRAQVTIIMGAHRIVYASNILGEASKRASVLSTSAENNAQQQVYNSCYQLCNNRIVNQYDKEHGLLWIERVPAWCKNKFLRSLFVAQNKLCAQAAPDTRERVNFQWADTNFEPYICSDNFFHRANNRHEISQSSIKLCLINDAWCAGTFLPEILYLTVYLSARLARQQFFYISHTRGRFVTRDGHVFTL